MTSSRTFHTISADGHVDRAAGHVAASSCPRSSTTGPQVGEGPRGRRRVGARARCATDADRAGRQRRGVGPAVRGQPVVRLHVRDDPPGGLLGEGPHRGAGHRWRRCRGDLPVTADNVGASWPRRTTTTTWRVSRRTTPGCTTSSPRPTRCGSSVWRKCLRVDIVRLGRGPPRGQGSPDSRGDHLRLPFREPHPVSAEDDPFWEAAEEEQMPVHIHTSACPRRASGGRGPARSGCRRAPAGSPDSSDGRARRRRPRGS